MSVGDAVLALVKAAVAPVVVYDGRVPGTPADRYVVLYADPGILSAQDVTHRSDLARFAFQLTYVTRGGQASRYGVEYLADKCRAALVDVFPSVAGWSTGPIEHVGTQPVRHDEDDPTAPVLYGSDQFSVLAARS